MARHGLFVGLVTLDLVYLTSHVPSSDEKIVAFDYLVAAGGPATNAAATFSYLKNHATLLGAVGTHPIHQLIRSDLEKCGVKLTDLSADRLAPPPVSSIIVTQATGERAVISLNAVQSQVSRNQISSDLLQTANIVLLDGHQMEISIEIAKQAKQQNIPLVVDGGSWKPGFEELLPLVDYAICSANFYPTGCRSLTDVLAYLTGLGIPHIAVTHGADPIQYISAGNVGQIEVPQTPVVDTLGAGDILHGAFCHYILHEEFAIALAKAAEVASYACQFFGTRSWMQ